MIGVPFYVMRFLDGHVITDRLPPGSRSPPPGAASARALVDALLEIHAADVTDLPLAAFARSGATSSARCAASRSCGRSTRPATSSSSRSAGG